MSPLVNILVLLLGLAACAGDLVECRAAAAAATPMNDILGDGFNMVVVPRKELDEAGQIVRHQPDEPLDWPKTIKAICGDRKVSIRSMSEMIEAIRLIKAAESKCTSRFMAAIYELEPILLKPKEQLCDDSSFHLMKEYHFRFIQPFQHSNRRPTQFEPLPRDLVKGQLHPEPRKYTVEFDQHDQVLMAPIGVRHFFLKFALQVSHQCKMDLVRNLETDSGRILHEGDIELMEPFTRRLLGENKTEHSVDFDSALYIPELDGRMERDNGEQFEPAGRQQHLVTNASESSGLYMTIAACKTRFKPMYDKLILPIVRLSKLGYDYQGEPGWRPAERHFLEGPLVRHWLIILHVCEIFKNTKLIRMDEESQLARQKSLDNKEALREALDSIDGEDDGDTAHSRHDSGFENHHDALESDEMFVEEGADEVDELADGAPITAHDGKLSEASDEEAELLDRKEDLLQAVDYAPSARFTMSDRLMIDSETELDWQLSLKEGHQSPFGFRGWARKLASCLKWALAKLDLERFAHYRRNSLWYSGILNFFSSVSNVASITVTIYGMAHG